MLTQLEGLPMSFFSGYVLGQAMNGKGNSGGAAMGFFGLFAFAFLLLLIGATIFSFLLPLYSIVHLSILAHDLTNVFGAALVAVFTANLVVSAYVLSLLGTTKQFYIWGAILSLINFTLLSSFNEFSEYDLMNLSGEPLIDALFSAMLCFVSIFGVRFLLAKLVSVKRREMIVSKTIKPTKWVASSKTIAGLIFVGSSLLLVVIAWRAIETYNRVYQFMDDTGRSYEEAFDFIYYRGRFEGDVTEITVVGVVLLLSIFHFAFLLRRKRMT